MIINNVEYAPREVSRVLTVPDCNVAGPNKIGGGHGEAKFYFGSKQELEEFICGNDVMNSFFLKADLLTYMLAAQHEYEHPSQNYAGGAQMAVLWRERLAQVQGLPDFIPFTVTYQRQIQGPRGYINSDDDAYQLFRLLSLPLISYISIMRLQSAFGQVLYYWKLFVDFDAIEQRRTVGLVLNYGGRNQPIEVPTPPQQIAPVTPIEPMPPATPMPQTGRDAAAQARYRRLLLEECPFCPITGIADERLLIASHIKPFVASNDFEAFDPKNGFILSPLFDKLFDQGFISFDSNKCLMVSNWLSPRNQTCCRVQNGFYVQALPLDAQREQYLAYHRQCVFKGY